jgi:hypothetical protein
MNSWNGIRIFLDGRLQQASANARVARSTGNRTPFLSDSGKTVSRCPSLSDFFLIERRRDPH